MLNILSYVGMSLQSELCLWALLGLARTIFDATLFKVNANLKQVWQMSMPEELSMPVQRVVRTIISGVMLVQCFTVYVYLATYIVLLYPIFLEERPTLVLPWLLLAAVRKLLCELTSLALGLGACLLLGPARPACIGFLVVNIASITPAFYVWMLVFSYYDTLKVAMTFKMCPASIPANDPDYGLELAVRRRRTKSLLDEHQLRRKLVANFNYGERHAISTSGSTPPSQPPSPPISNQASEEDIKRNSTNPFLITSERQFLNLQTYEDWSGNEITLPRDADRIMEQFVVMLLRISAFLKSGASDPAKVLASSSLTTDLISNIELHNATLEPELLSVGSNRFKNSASYLQEYPKIFNKKQSESKFGQITIQSDSNDNSKNEPIDLKTEKPLRKKLTVPDKINELNETTFQDRQMSVIQSADTFTSLPQTTKPHETGVTFADSDESIKNNSIEYTQRLDLKDENIKPENKTDEIIEDSSNEVRKIENEDSLQSILDRMRSSLKSNNRRGSNQNDNEHPTTSSKATNDKSHDEESNNQSDPGNN